MIHNSGTRFYFASERQDDMGKWVAHHIRDVRFAYKVDQIGPKLDISGTFSDHISDITWKSPEFVPFWANLTHFGAISDTHVMRYKDFDELDNFLCFNTVKLWKHGKITPGFLDYVEVGLKSCSLFFYFQNDF